MEDLTSHQENAVTMIDPADARLLVVEDNVSNFTLIVRLLTELGIQHCEWHTSGWKVVEAADRLPRVDLILLDIHLPYEDGFEVARKMRAHPRFAKTRVVAVTADANEETMIRSQAEGLDGFIGKPLDPDYFPRQICRILNGEAVWEWQSPLVSS
jgi:two-component system cell cycle response regulator DivK